MISPLVQVIIIMVAASCRALGSAWLRRGPASPPPTGSPTGEVGKDRGLLYSCIFMIGGAWKKRGEAQYNGARGPWGVRAPLNYPLGFVPL